MTSVVSLERKAATRQRVLALTNSVVLRQGEAAVMCGITSKHIRELEKEGKFCARVQLGENSVGYRLKDLERWLEERVAQSGGA